MVVIRELTTLAEMEEVQVIEHKVWGMPPIPTHQTLTAVKNGGIMIGAYDGDKMVGFSYGFPGFKDGKIYLCSHMLGIDAAYRSQGIGERLKWKQREIAIAKGYDRMHWTYDPLETRNGYLNLTKLNGICDTYIENCYGEMDDEFNKVLPSDRFEVHWYLKARMLLKNMNRTSATPCLQARSHSMRTACRNSFRHGGNIDGACLCGVCAKIFPRTESRQF